MSAGEEQAVEPETAEAEPAGESRQMSERTARIILVVVACGAMWGIVAAFSWMAYVVTGVLLTLGWQKVAGWIGRRQGNDGDAAELENEEAVEEPTETFTEILHRLANPHVFLADFAKESGLPMETARAVIEGLGSRVRRAVRNGEDTGVGVHKDDLPPLPRPSPGTPERGVEQEQRNQPTRPTTEPIGLAGVVVKDGSEVSRRHRLR